MTELRLSKLENMVSGLQSDLEIAKTFNDINLIRSYVAETALAFLISGSAIDFDQIEKILLVEFDSPNRRKKVKEAVDGLRQRTLEPSTPRIDE